MIFSDELPVVLLVESRRATFVDHVLARRDLRVVLLRIDGVAQTAEHLQKTASVPTFTLRPRAEASAEAARYLAWCKATGIEPRFFCNPNEAYQETAQAFARAAGLPALGPEQVSWVRNKPAMKDRYAELGIAHARYRMIEKKSDVLPFARELGWPVVVKPVDSDSCIDTFRVNDERGLAALDELGSHRKWMVEEFIEGREYQLCAIVSSGRVLDAYISRNPAPLLTIFDGAMNANITLARSEPQPVDGKALAQRIVDGMDIPCGYLHGEFFVRPNGEVCMGEIAARLSGCEVPMNHGLARGFDFLGAIMDTYLGRRPALAYTADKAVGDLLLPTHKGVVKRVSRDEDLLGLPGVIGSHVAVRPGDTLAPMRASSASSGYVHVEGPTAVEVERRMQAVLDRYVIELE